MLLAIDIGNTNTAFGAFDGETLQGTVRFTTHPVVTVDECGFQVDLALRKLNLEKKDLSGAVLASVVPAITGAYQAMSREYLGFQHIVVVSHRIRLPILIKVDQPEQVGADRIANAAAGYRRYGGPVLVVDFGTATTFDVVDDTGAYIGGVIAPGPETSMAELARKAARLFEVRIEPPEAAVGKSTAGALKSGLFYGTIGQVDYIIEQILRETGFKDYHVVATGGFAAGIDRYSRHISQVDPTLTLHGLRLIAELNRA